MSELRTYADAWVTATASLQQLVASLSPADFERPTDCPGWSVLDVLAHLAALERELATGEQPANVQPIEGQGPAAWWTEAGVTERRGRQPAEVLAEYREMVARRAADLAERLPDDPGGKPERTPGAVAWDNRTLLRNRVLDTWVHEQDIRRATDHPGGLTGAPAEIVEGIFSAAWPFVLAKRAAAPAGTRIGVVLDGRRSDYVVSADGRGRQLDSAEADVPDDPEGIDDADAVISLNREALTILGAGRRTPDDLPDTALLSLTGDLDLAGRVLAGLNLTP